MENPEHPWVAGPLGDGLHVEQPADATQKAWPFTVECKDGALGGTWAFGELGSSVSGHGTWSARPQQVTRSARPRLERREAVRS
jgi:hypothetical protein